MEIYLGLLLLFGLTLTINTYQLDDNIADEIRDQLKSNDEFLEDFAPTIDLNEDDDFEIPMNDPGFRFRRAVERVVREVRRPIRQVREVVRRVIVDPVRRVIREVTGGVTRLVRSRTLRFRRSSGGNPVTPKPPPPTKAQCRIPSKSCPSSWDVFDQEYDILDEIFKAPCQKYSTCNSCATQRKWAHSSCLGRLLNDMKGMCKAYTAEEYTVCNSEAAKFHTLATMQHRAVNPSPGWCIDNCVNQRGNPVVELSVG